MPDEPLKSNELTVFGSESDGDGFALDDFLHLADDLRAIRAALGVTNA